jgi:hypothetical protein
MFSLLNRRPGVGWISIAAGFQLVSLMPDCLVWKQQGGAEPRRTFADFSLWQCPPHSVATGLAERSTPAYPHRLQPLTPSLACSCAPAPLSRGAQAVGPPVMKVARAQHATSTVQHANMQTCDMHHTSMQPAAAALNASRCGGSIWTTRVAQPVCAVRGRTRGRGRGRGRKRAQAVPEPSQAFGGRVQVFVALSFRIPSRAALAMTCKRNSRVGLRLMPPTSKAGERKGRAAKSVAKGPNNRGDAKNVRGKGTNNWNKGTNNWNKGTNNRGKRGNDRHSHCPLQDERAPFRIGRL